jgi:hypothetical protein
VREPEAPLAPGVACERTYQMLIGGEPKPVLCRWFAPEPHPEGDWMCHAEVTWPGGRVQKRSAGGIDSAQALILAFSAVGVELLIRDEPVYWSELDDDLGLPIVSILADDLAERKARFDDRVRRHPLWASVCAILSADWGPFVRSSAHENYQPYLRDLIGRLQERQPVERIAAFLGELRGYIDAREAFESDAATDLVAAGKLRALVEDVK